MASSTLDPDNMPESDRSLGIGHGTDALGPSDISDSGSDVQGGLRAVEEEVLGLDRGTNEDPDSHTLEVSHDNDDMSGTGEQSTAGRSGDVDLDSDIGVDRIDYVNPENDPDFDLNAAPPPRPGAGRSADRR